MRFEKVSFEQFAADMEKWMPEMSKMLYKRFYDRVTMPKRQTKGSAGYDFVTPVRIMLEPGQQAVIPSGIRAVFSEEELETWHLEVFVRSSIGLKKGGILPNSVAIIDADYFQGESGGDIGQIPCQAVGDVVNARGDCREIVEYPAYIISKSV